MGDFCCELLIPDVYSDAAVYHAGHTSLVCRIFAAAAVDAIRVKCIDGR